MKLVAQWCVCQWNGKPVNKIVHGINNIKCSTVRSKLRSGATEGTTNPFRKLKTVIAYGRGRQPFERSVPVYE